MLPKSVLRLPYYMDILSLSHLNIDCTHCFVSPGPTLTVRYTDMTPVKVRQTMYMRQKTPSVQMRRLRANLLCKNLKRVIHVHYFCPC